jgi:hemolysin type calcium-binding protein
MCRRGRLGLVPASVRLRHRRTVGADVICGLGGNDVIYASGGNHTILGGRADEAYEEGGTTPGTRRAGSGLEASPERRRLVRDLEDVDRPAEALDLELAERRRMDPLLHARHGERPL